jgi:hypothetical protein
VNLYRQGEHSTAELAASLASPAPPATAPCNDTSPKAWPADAPPQTEPLRDIERSRVAGVSRKPYRCGTPGPFPSLFAL